LGGGKLRTDAEEQRRKDSGEKGRALLSDWLRNENEVKVSHALEKVAGELGLGDNIGAGKIFILQLSPQYS
jgi:hypothetical protein